MPRPQKPATIINHLRSVLSRLFDFTSPAEDRAISAAIDIVRAGEKLSRSFEPHTLTRRFAKNQIGEFMPDSTLLNPSELATILAALRLFQKQRGGPESMLQFAGIKPLTDKQIDTLCERINR
jgi:hypothetical protein